MSKNHARKFLVIAALMVGGACVARPALAVTDANGITLLGGSGGGATSTPVAPSTITRDALVTYKVTINWYNATHGYQPRVYTVQRTFHYYDGAGWQMTGDEWAYYTSAWTNIAGTGWTAVSHSIAPPVVRYF